MNPSTKLEAKRETDPQSQKQPVEVVESTLKKFEKNAYLE